MTKPHGHLVKLASSNQNHVNPKHGTEKDKGISFSALLDISTFVCAVVNIIFCGFLVAFGHPLTSNSTPLRTGLPTL